MKNETDATRIIFHFSYMYAIRTFFFSSGPPPFLISLRLAGGRALRGVFNFSTVCVRALSFFRQALFAVSRTGDEVYTLFDPDFDSMGEVGFVLMLKMQRMIVWRMRSK